MRKIVVRKRDFLINIVFGLVFLICSLACKLKLTSYIAVFFFIAYMIYTIVNRKEVFIKYLAFIFMAVAAIFGTVIIELGNHVYLKELQTSGEFVGSLPLLVFSYWLLICIFMTSEGTYRVEINTARMTGIAQSAKTINRISFVVFVLFGILFATVAAHPAFLLEVDRFTYASQFQNSRLIETLVYIAPLLLIFPILSLIYGNKVLGGAAILLYVLYCLWVGNKFGPFFTLICVFLLVYYRRILDMDKRKLKRIIQIIVIVFTLVLVFAIYFSTSISGYSASGYIQQRSAQQGQLWWKTFDLCESPHPEDFIDEINAIGNGKNSISDNVGSNNGVYRIMYMCAPKSLIDFKLSTGSRYTEAGFAIVYYYFGYIGLIAFVIICGIWFSATLNCFIKNLNKGDYIKALIMLRFFILERAFISMFEFKDFLDIVTLASLIYLLVMRNRKISISKNNGIKIVKI